MYLYLWYNTYHQNLEGHSRKANRVRRESCCNIQLNTCHIEDQLGSPEKWIKIILKKPLKPGGGMVAGSVCD